MNLSTRIEQIARSAAKTDADDPPGLVELRDALSELCELAELTEHAGAKEMVGGAVEAIECVVLRETETPEAELSKVHETIDYLQDLVEAAASGMSAPPPPGGDEGVSDVDADLFEAWVSSSEDTLNEIEAQVLSIVSGESSEETIAEVRRRIHTIKGECGVVSAHTAQELFHEAESAIDRSIEQGERFPADEILDLVDWMRRLIEEATAASAATWETNESLLNSLRSFCGGEAAGATSSDAPGEVVAEPADAAPETTTASEAVNDEQGSNTQNAVDLEPQAGDTASVDTPVPGGAPAEPADATGDTAVEHAEPKPADQEAPTNEPEASEQAAAPSEAATTASPAPASEPSDEGVVELVAEDDEMLSEFISESREHIAAAEAALLELETDSENAELINTVFRAFHTIKGVAGFLNLTPIVELAHKSEFLLDAARNGTTKVCTGFLDLTLGACDLLTTLISVLEDGEAPQKRVYNEMIRRLDAALEGDIPARGSLPALETSAPAKAPAPSETPGASPTATAQAAKPESAPSGGARDAANAKRRADQTVKVNTQRLDGLVDMVGELVIGHQMVVQDPNIQDLTEQRTQRNLVHVGKIIRDLQEVAMSLRMVTLKGTFQKMTRLVRDLSAKSEKKINLKIEGEDTELDRNVVEEIGDPLVHMIRNACDHGLEGPQERIEAGKDPVGNLTLRAFHKGGAIIIEVEDDGRGLRREKILTKAIERGIVASEREGAEMSDRDVYQLIFAPGFSTADKVTDVSGRGVGMDVVRRNIQALRGKVEIRSTPGKGSTFVLSLPLTMAIIDGMVIRCGTHRYVLPTLSIEQSFRPDPGEINTVMERGETIMVRGMLLPIYRLSDLFGIEQNNTDPNERLLVVLEANGSRCCLEVDELLGQQQVVIKTLGKGVGALRGVSGGAILGDGRVAPIIDVVGLLSQAQDLPADDDSPSDPS